MKRVQLEAVGWAGAGATGVVLAVLGMGLALPWQSAQLPPLGWLAALGYLVVSNALLVRALRRRRSERFGPANAVTSVRSTIVGLVTGLVVASWTAEIPVLLLVGLAIPALALDAVDGWVARRTGSTSELGGRFDMEVDAFLLLVLSGYVAQLLGPWVLAIGLLRYAFVAAGWLLPWLTGRLPYRYWRKVVTAVAGIALTFAATGLAPVIAAVVVAVALALLLESFGRDVLWLAVRRRDTAPPRPAGQPPTARTARR